MIKKPCRKCGEYRTIADYDADPRYSDGRRHVCKVCRRDQQRTRDSAQWKEERVAILRSIEDRETIGMRTCKTCHVDKPLHSEFFQTCPRSRRGFVLVCRLCRNESTKRIHQSAYATEAGRELYKGWARKHTTCFSPLLWKIAWKLQNGKCEICKTDLASLQEEIVNGVHADHCHKTKTPRGILCRGCNIGLGNFSDDIARLRAAVQYLESPL